MHRIAVLSTLAMAACAQVAGLGDYGATEEGGGGGGPSGGDGPGAGGAQSGAPAGGAGGAGGAKESYEAVVLGDGPAGYWRLGERQGNVAIDLIADQHGVYDSEILVGVPGLIALDEDRAAEIPTTADDATSIDVTVELAGVDFAGPFSLEIWVDGFNGTGFGRLINKVTTGANGPEAGFELYVQDPSTLAFRGFDGSVGFDVFSFEDFSAGPRHVVVTQESGTLQLFVDGDAILSSVLVSALTVGTGPLRFGRSYQGTLDEVAIYGRALDAVEIQEHFVVGSTGPR